MKWPNCKYLILLSFLVVLSCDVEEEPIPAYIEILPFSLDTRPDQGSSSNNIEYAYVYADDQLVGGFYIPGAFPVLASGITTVIVDPAVKANGLSFSPDIYPFYERLTYNLQLEPGKTTTIDPRTQYKDNVRFALIEDFNGTSHIFTDDLDENPDSEIQLVTNGAFQGKSGLIELTQDHPSIIFGTDFDRNALEVLPNNGTPVWMELDYKTDVEVLFGVTGVDIFGSPTTFAEFGVNPKSEWNKIYFDITQFVFDNKFVAFQIIGLAQLPSALQSANIYLDNIKILYFDY